jgi:N-methylhydantoinase B
MAASTAPTETPTGAPVDLIDAEIFQRRIFSIANEMGLIMIRTTGDPVIAESVDFSTFIADARGEVIGYASYSSWHLGPARQAVKHLLSVYSLDEIRPGDAFFCSDPHTTGALHPPDVGVVRPIFAAGELIAWCWAEAHIADVGGMAPGGFAPDATESYQEGLRFPGIRIAVDGELSDDFLRLLRTNLRVADRTINNIRCFLAACNVCDSRLQEVIEEYGPDRFETYNELNKTLSERAIRKRIESLPDGSYTATDYVEHDKLYRVTCTATVAGDQMTIDYTGTAPQAERFINQSYSASVAVTVTPMLFCLAPDVPLNEGAVRAFDVRVPSGTILNPVEPAPTSSGHMETGMRTSKVVASVLAEMQAGSSLPEVRKRTLAPCQECFSGVLFYAPTADGELLPFLDMNGGGEGLGAEAGSDGLDVGGGLNQLEPALPDIEVNELFYPVLYLWRRLNQGSGGAGEHRGGQGVEFAYTPWGTPGGNLSVFVASSQLPPHGVFGGYPAGTCGVEVVTGADVRDLFAAATLPTSLAEVGGETIALDAKQSMPLGPGEVLMLREGGGGGYGDPLDRDPELVAADVRDGYIRGERAGAAYGVVVADGKIDGPATEALRASMRGERTAWSRELTFEGAAPDGPERPLGGTLRVRGEGAEAVVVCGCGTALAPLDGDLRAYLASRTSPLSERLGELGTWVKPRPGIQLVEAACPSCGTLHLTDVAVDETPKP